MTLFFVLLLTLMEWSSLVSPLSTEAVIGKGSQALQNPSFDEPSGGGEIVGWLQRGEAFGQASLVHSPVVSAPNALLLTAIGPGSSGESSLMLYQILDPILYGGKRVRFGARVKTAGAGINLVLYTPEKMANDFDPNVQRNEFMDRAGVLEIPAHVTFLSFGIQIFGPTGSRAWVDDAFVQLEEASTQTPAPQAAESLKAMASPVVVAQETSASDTAQVEIDSTRIERSLSPLLFGMHIEWVQNGNGLLEAQTPTLRSTVLDRLRPLRIPIFRFPGGILADYYDWKLGSGTPASRGTSTNVFTGTKEVHRFGSPEFIALLRATNAEPLITTNYGTGDANLARGWATSLLQAGVKPRFWEVGNEIYLSAPTIDAPNGRAIYHEPQTYAKDFASYRSAIQAVIPDAKVGIIAHHDTGAFALAQPNNLDWTEKMLKNLTTRADFVAVHNAYAPIILDDSFDFTDEARRKDAYRSLYAGATATKENLSQIAQIVGQNSPANAGIPIAVTEFGPFFGLSSKPEMHATYVDQSRTLASALYVASLLDVFIGDGRVFMADYTNPIHQWYGSLITNTDQGLVLTPTYYLYVLYRSRFESELVPTKVTSPSFDAKACGIVKAQQGLPDLLARASISKDKRRLTAMLVNRSLDRKLTTKLTLGGFAAKTMDCQILTASSAAAANGPHLTRSTISNGAEIAPRALPCTVSSSLVTIQIPPNAIVSIVANQ